MNIRILALTTLALACPLTASQPSTAQEGPEMEAMRANCGGDYLRLCAGMKPGGPEVKACFKRHRQNLSPGCSQAITAYEQSRAGSSSEAAD
ncbi:MAG: 3',5'-cyclic-nucleotide phosphodiesterase [Methylobacterium sp.]|uniref:3',5'-cyclic-nucleotide phosphodiesterase n=1 Tax=Methylobacterium sp. TaxID=409 RepID=UPI002717FBF4|nr:3',5'-cyclic-nucleotide phosphodiesterase [Methylobacterium sp.]MDO9429217.1 3',5'-cyclic-nucleotide phosphodiesterase [Methylobacterium sp.]